MIKGVSDIKRLPRIEKIRLGVWTESQQGKEYPKAVDYFVCPPEFEPIFGKEPKELEVMLPSDDVEEVFPQFRKCYGASRGLFCKGDGEKALRRDEKVGGLVEIPCPGEACEYTRGKQCKMIGTLNVIIPRIPGLGVWQIDTSSYHSIVNINNCLRLIRELRGRLTGAIFRLKLEPLEVYPEGKKKTVYVMTLDTDKRMIDLVAESRGQKALPKVQVELPNDDSFPEDLYPRSLFEEEDTDGESQAEVKPEAQGASVEPLAFSLGRG